MIRNKCSFFRNHNNGVSFLFVLSGHARTNSEISAAGSEESHSDAERVLHRRVSELTELLDARETKLVEVCDVASAVWD